MCKALLRHRFARPRRADAATATQTLYEGELNADPTRTLHHPAYL
jgi:hypothetical protein